MMANTKPGTNDQYQSYMTYDEYGRPFIILKEQSEKEQISGLEVLKVSIPTFYPHIQLSTLMFCSPLSTRATFTPQKQSPP